MAKEESEVGWLEGVDVRVGFKGLKKGLDLFDA